MAELQYLLYAENKRSVLIVRVHKLVSKAVWSWRYRQINDFEKMLAEHNVHILKFYLHISKAEQLKRLQKRQDDPTRNWKANPQDFEERKRWAAYQKAYEDVLTETGRRPVDDSTEIIFQDGADISVQ